MSAWKPAVDSYAPCPCGSGKKYKFCCLGKDREAAQQKAEAEGAPPAPRGGISRPGARIADASRPAKFQEKPSRGPSVPRSTSRGK